MPYRKFLFINFYFYSHYPGSSSHTTNEHRLETFSFQHHIKWKLQKMIRKLIFFSVIYDSLLWSKHAFSLFSDVINFHVYFPRKKNFEFQFSFAYKQADLPIKVRMISVGTRSLCNILTSKMYILLHGDYHLK